MRKLTKAGGPVGWMDLPLLASPVCLFYKDKDLTNSWCSPICHFYKDVLFYQLYFILIKVINKNSTLLYILE